MGRSPDILRILWPFDTSLGNNQTFATREWTTQTALSSYMKATAMT